MTDPNASSSAPAAAPEGAIPAATLVIMRPAPGGGPDEILMVKRSAAMVFAAGAVVFPGGRIDPDDHVVAARHGFAEDDIDGAARLAALLETLEATGLAVGRQTLGEPCAEKVPRAPLERQLRDEILVGGGERVEPEPLFPFC